MRSGQKYIWIAVIAALLLLGLFYFLVTPDSGLMPRCIFKQLTGWQCPGCGSQRMVHAMLHGNFAEALAYNYFMPIFLLILILSAGLDTICRRDPQRYHSIYKLNLPLILLILLILWTILRNLLGV